MTIAIGVLCNDGVVLGVDAQLSVDGAKLVTPKIVLFAPVSNYHLVVGVQGHGDASSLAIDSMRETLAHEFTGKPATVSEITAYIGECLAAVFRDHIDSAPADERNYLSFSLLIAIHQERNVHLFRTNRAMVVPVKSRPHPWWCMGVGFEFANYALDLLLHPHCSVEVAAQVAAYVIAVTKDSVEGVGKDTDVHVIQNDGRHWSLSLPDLREIEKHFQEFFRAFREVVSSVDAASISDEGAKMRLGFLEKGILALRASQLKRQQQAAKRLAESQEAPPDHQSTTADSPLPLPSPESPGGSGES